MNDQRCLTSEIARRSALTAGLSSSSKKHNPCKMPLCDKSVFGVARQTAATSLMRCETTFLAYLFEFLTVPILWYAYLSVKYEKRIKTASHKQLLRDRMIIYLGTYGSKDVEK
jgi:hypothetical protein